MGKVTLVRPDGSTFEADRDDAEHYRALGYSPESTEDTHSRNIEAAREEHFTTTGQKVITGLEGFANGLSVGGYTTLFGGSEDEQDRARYNPGTRLGSEIVGAVLPALITDGGTAEASAGSIGRSVLRSTPSGLLARGAEAAAEATTATKTGHALVRGVVEGAAMGGAAEATNAKLSGDPVTAEAVVAGMGWGALWGGGLGYLAGKVGVTAEKIAAGKTAATEAVEHGAIPEQSWNSFRAVVHDVHKTALSTVDEAAAKVASAVPEHPDVLTARVLAHVDQMEEAQGALFNRIDVSGGWAKKGAQKFRNEIYANNRNIAEAVNGSVSKGTGPDYSRLEELTQRHGVLMKAMADLTKQAAPELEPFVLKAATEGAKSLDDLKSLRAVADALDRFPFTAEGFSKMTPAKMEKVAAAAEAFIKNAPEELAGQKSAMGKAINDLVASAGLSADTLSPAQKLRAAHEALRNSKTVGATEEAEKLRAGGFGSSTAKYVGGRAASKAAKEGGAGIVGRGLAYEAGSKLVGGLLALKNGVLSTLVSTATKWAPAAAKVGGFVGPKLDPLKVRLDGTIEQADLPRKQLMLARMQEIREAAPTINDTLYRAVEPIAGSHTELAAQMNRAAVAQFQALASRMPRDHGMAFNRMKSLWSPDAIATEGFARAYEVFHNPVGTAVRWLQNPRSITPEGARAMKDFNPELWATLRVEMVSRLSQPGAMDKMTYSEQVGLGQLLDLRIHSTQDPRFIKAQQLMFQNRKEPLPARPTASGNNSNNPSGTSSGMTASQRITEH